MKNRYYGLVRSPMRFEYTINPKSIYVYNSLNFIYGNFLRNEFLYYATINIFEKHIRPHICLTLVLYDRNICFISINLALSN